MPGRSPALARSVVRGAGATAAHRATIARRRAGAAGLLAVAAIASGCASLGFGSRVFPLAPPDSALLAATGPDSFDVRFETSKGPFTMRVHRDWAPRGADRVYYLVRARFFDDARFFRVVNGRDGKPFVAQFGINGDTAVTRAWRGARIPDDPPRRSNVRGTVSFAAGGPNTRTTQIYINYRDNSRLDTLGFAVFGQVIRGMSATGGLLLLRVRRRRARRHGTQPAEHRRRRQRVPDSPVPETRLRAHCPHRGGMETMSSHALHIRRWRIAIALTIAVAAIYFGFILLIAYRKDVMATRIAPGLTTGILLGALVIVLSWWLTWVYVRWANRHFDAGVDSLGTEGR
jgi:peptidyl-prolyl cis-trans isomerase A (cyclophilin A)